MWAQKTWRGRLGPSEARFDLPMLGGPFGQMSRDEWKKGNKIFQRQAAL
jgi:hypothetical protein